MSKLLNYIEENKKFWDDPESIEQELLSGNETLVDYFMNELKTIADLAHKDTSRNIIAVLCNELTDYGKERSDLIELLLYLGVEYAEMPDEVLWNDEIEDYEN